MVTAIGAYTSNVAKSLGVNHMTGSIGKVRAVMTMLQGEIVFSYVEN